MTQVMLDVRQLAVQLGVSPRHVAALRSRGLLPQPVYLGRSVRWRADDIAQWVAAGCGRPDAGEAVRP
ncbi:MAG: helix-turn-helix domain-containing protein [Phycisphaerae bacterium]